MELVQHLVSTYDSKTLPWPETIVMPIGDVQCGVPQCDEDRLRHHIEWGLEHNAFFLGMGDYADMANPTDRKKLASANLNDTTTQAITEKAEADVERFLTLVKGTEGKWLGLLHGHHYMTFSDGTTSDTRIANALGAPFLGDAAIVRLVLCQGAVPKPLGVTCDIFVRHGSGSAATEASALTKVYRDAAVWESDIYLHGHYHRKVATKKPRTYMDGEGVLRHRNTIMAVTGSFLRGYLQGSQANGRPGGSYVEAMGLPPVTLGGIVLYARAAELNNGKGRLDMDIGL